MPAKGSKRGPIFDIDTDMFLEVWKNNQHSFQKNNATELKGLDLRKKDEASFKATFDSATLQSNFRSLCLNIFDRCISSYNTEDDIKAICEYEKKNPKDEHKRLSAWVAASGKKAKDDAAYLFIKDKVLAKAKNLYDNISKHSDKILLPIGYTARNYGITSGPKGRDWSAEAERWG